VHKDVPASICGLNETVALLRVEPLHRTARHRPQSSTSAPTIRARPTYPLTIPKIPEAVYRLLESAAARRQMSPAELAAQIIGGTVTRGSVDKTTARWQRYCATSAPVTPRARRVKQFECSDLQRRKAKE
jgi:hypothetical protein